jgi:hypothetical protein
VARQTSDREDLMREATALVERAELIVPGLAEPVIAGFRAGGAASFFFGADPVLQFNAAGELRRAYAEGALLKAEAGHLVRLVRERSARETALVREELTDGETERLLEQWQASLAGLQAALAAGQVQVASEVPAGAEVARRVAAWLAARPAQIAIAARPHAGG